MNARWLGAYRSKDGATLRSILAPDFQATTPAGTTIDRETLIASGTRGRRKISSVRWRDVRVRLFGAAAIVTGRSEIVGCDGERDISGSNIYTDVYVRRDGHWQAVAAHVARLADAGSPSAACPAAGGS